MKTVISLFAIATGLCLGLSSILPGSATWSQTPASGDWNQPGNFLAFNNDWRDNTEATIQNTGIAPANDKESAILATLAPGSYTAIVRGLSDNTGVGLVEVYHLQ